MRSFQVLLNQQDTYSTAALIAELKHPNSTLEEVEDIFLDIIHGRLMEGNDRWSVGKELEEIARSIPVRRTISLSAARQATFFHLATLSKEAFTTAQTRPKVVSFLKSHERSPHKGKEVLLEYINMMERVTGKWIDIGAGGLKFQIELVQGGLRSIKESVENSKSLSNLVEQVQLQSGYISLSQLLNHLRSLAIASDSLRESEKILKAWAQTGLKAGESRFSLGSQLEEIRRMLPHALHPAFPPLLESLNLPPSPVHPHAQGIASQPSLIEVFLQDSSDPEFAREVLLEWIGRERRAWRKVWGPKEKEGLRAKLMHLESQLENPTLTPVFYSVMSNTFLSETSIYPSTAPHAQFSSLERSSSSVKPLQRLNRSHYVLASSFKRVPRTDNEFDLDQSARKRSFSSSPPTDSMSRSEIQKTMYSPSLSLADSISSLDRSPYPNIPSGQNRQSIPFIPSASHAAGATVRNVPRHHQSISSSVHGQPLAQDLRYTSSGDGHLPSPKLTHWRTRSSSFGRSAEDVSMSQASLPILEEQSEDTTTHIDLEDCLYSTSFLPDHQSRSVDGHLSHAFSLNERGRALQDMPANREANTFSSRNQEWSRNVSELTFTLPRATASGDSLHLSKLDTDLVGHDSLGRKTEESLQNLRTPKSQSLTQLSKSLQPVDISIHNPSTGVPLTSPLPPADKPIPASGQRAPSLQKKRFSFFHRRRPTNNPPVAVINPEPESTPIQASQLGADCKPSQDVPESSQPVNSSVQQVGPGGAYDPRSQSSGTQNAMAGFAGPAAEDTRETPRPDSPSSPSDESLLTRIWSHTGHRRFTVVNPDVSSNSSRSSLLIPPAGILSKDSGNLDSVETNAERKGEHETGDKEQQGERNEKGLAAIAQVGSPVVEIRSSDAYPGIISRGEEISRLSRLPISSEDPHKGQREITKPQEAELSVNSIIDSPIVSLPTRTKSVVNKTTYMDPNTPDRFDSLSSTDHTALDPAPSALTLRGVFDSLPPGVVHSSGFVLEILMNYIDAERSRAMADPRTRGWGDKERGKVGWFLGELEESLVATNAHLVSTFNQVRTLTDCPPQSNSHPKSRMSRSGRAMFANSSALPSTTGSPSLITGESSTPMTPESSSPLLTPAIQPSRQDSKSASQFRKKLRSHGGEEADPHLNAYAGYQDLIPPANNGDGTDNLWVGRRDQMSLPLAARDEMAERSNVYHSYFSKVSN